MLHVLSSYFCELLSVICNVAQGRKMYQLVDMFALPEMTLYANVIQVSVNFSVKYIFIALAQGSAKSGTQAKSGPRVPSIRPVAAHQF